MSDKKHIVADELFRRLRMFFNDEDEAHKQNIDDFIDSQLNCVRICSVLVTKETERNPLDSKYNEKSQEIAKYLTTLNASHVINRKKFQKFKMNALKFLTKERHLFQRADKNMSLRRVMNQEEN